MRLSSCLRSDLKMLKQVWDMIALVDGLFVDWMRTTFKNVDTDFLLEETKKLQKQVHTLICGNDVAEGLTARRGGGVPPLDPDFIVGQCNGVPNLGTLPEHYLKTVPIYEKWGKIGVAMRFFVM